MSIFKNSHFLLLSFILFYACGDFQQVTIDSACDSMMNACPVEYTNKNECLTQLDRQKLNESNVRCLTEVKSCSDVQACYTSNLN